jgi:uncharacterized protein (DUF2126 family)/transglutaminase-like putative cysteine protease
MGIRVALRHRTQYRYDRRVQLSPQVVRLRPAAHCRTAIEAFSLQVEPEPHFINWQQDPFGNYLARVVFPETVDKFFVDVGLIADLTTINPFDFFLEPEAELFPFEYETSLRRDLLPYLGICTTEIAFDALIAQLVPTCVRAGRRIIDVLVDINQHLQRTLRYDIRMEPGVFTPDETLERGHGSCRDFAWLLVNVLRRLGIAARFVSGYSIQLVADQKPLEGPAGVSQDCTDLHAWAEAYLPGAGWVGLDATSGLFCGEGHIPLACTAEPSSAAPISGDFTFDPRFEGDQPKSTFSVDMGVTRIEDRPRPTKSYTDEQWEAILSCGDAVERILLDNDVRLTMGGEPTFVSIDTMESAEWNTDALGPTKAQLSDGLIRRLRRRFAPTGLIVHGQGKWYPGEPLPRWAYSLYFRKDGEPIWNDGDLIADASNHGHDTQSAQTLIHRIITCLGVSGDFVIPAYEDVFYHLWRERRLPSNVDPFDSQLDDEMERTQLRRVFEQGLAAVVGYAVPLRARTGTNTTHSWASGLWFLRAERLYLLPGDSPMGYRLPLDSLPWAHEGDLTLACAQDPFADFAPLPQYRELAATAPIRQVRGAPANAPKRFESAANLVRTALCVEPRGGILHVFLPPIESLPAYLELVATIEAAVRELKLVVRIEGYPPPYHPLLEKLSITPDPGVIEVNIHPAHNWKEVVEHTAALYDDARMTRLGTDKFMLDGRHTGTGGGNHVVLGGATPTDSPFLRRPELLLSLVGFFNNHPALSYLFSGLFVGPTSQAPRIDEARNDCLYELEIARQTLEQAGTNAPPWLVDRALRHLLVDVAGNTHRTEFCIDKLYSPDSITGRLGLVEMRAFEMPPDARMSCAQQLLVRALVAQFWQQPYRRKLLRWGTALHDRFALPHFIWEDLTDALLDVSPLGVRLMPEWYLPHWEFRFPRLGRFAALGMEVELRQAIEPWHVLGEENRASGTARYVDSSVERIQVAVRGMIEPRYGFAVAGRPLPLFPTGRSSEYVAGVRYKAWKPESSLHPTIECHVPLVFDLYDKWNQRSVGGCTYHVSHPGGLAYDVYPTNGIEAESRRMSRFLPWGHTPGVFALRNEPRSLEHPLTLDLRREA